MNRRQFISLAASASVIAGVEPVALAASTRQRIFRAGAATSNITPALGVLLDGPISQNGVALHIHDELLARCLVLDDGAVRVAIVICDLTMVADEVFNEAKALIHQHTGLPADRILMAATHTHSSPRAIRVGTGALDEEYHRFLAVRIADSVRRAINNLAPARIGWNRGSKPELVFNRRWFMTTGTEIKNPFGDKTDHLQTNPPPGAESLGEPAGPVDAEVAVLSIQHTDGRPLALLANYGLHYIGGVPNGQVSADYFGVFADQVQKLLGADRQEPPFVAMMSNGTSGDVNGRNFRHPAARKPPYVQIQEVAGELAREAHRIYRQIGHRPHVDLAMVESELQLGVRRPDAKRLAWAQHMLAVSKNPKNVPRDVVYARETLILDRLPPIVPVKLQALRIGELAITAIPCEVFAATGLEIKKLSPFKQTFTISLANGYHGYLPTPRDHELGGYETWPARSSYLEVEASEKIREEILRLLKQVSAFR